MKTFDELMALARKNDGYWIAVAMDDFTEEICALMKREGITRGALAQKLGVRPPYITKLLRGDGNITIKTMVRLARVFGKTINIELPSMTAATNAFMPTGVSCAVDTHDISGRLWFAPLADTAYSACTHTTTEINNEIEQVAA
jgi:transcriptional regulator with XRE-family HTH domain